ncbi:MAG: glycosyltransferase 87 family protein [Promethearchaeota archaeon]
MKINILEINKIYLLSVFNLVFILLSIVFFPNKEELFTPNMFVNIFGFFGFFIIFHDRIKVSHLSLKKLLMVGFLVRMAFIKLRIVFFALKYNYTVISDVEVYELWARSVISPVPFPYNWYDYRFGEMPMLYLYLLLHLALHMSSLPVFWNQVMFGLTNLVLEIGILIMIYKIGQIIIKEQVEVTRGNQDIFLDRKSLLRRSFLYSISFISIYYFNIKGYYDPFPIFLSVIGVYFFKKKRYFLSALFLTLSTLTKLYAGFFLYAIILFYLKRKRIKVLLIYAATFIVVTIISFEILFLFIHYDPILGYFKILNDFINMLEYFGSGIRLNQSLLLLIYKSPVYYLILAAAFLLITFIVLKARRLEMSTFSAVLAIVIMIMPWIDQRYELWIMPFLTVAYFGSKKIFKFNYFILFLSIFFMLFFEQLKWDYGFPLLITDGFSIYNVLYLIFGQSLFYISLLIIVMNELNFAHDNKIFLYFQGMQNKIMEILHYPGKNSSSGKQYRDEP